MDNKIRPVNEVKGIDLRFRHMTDGNGFKRYLDEAMNIITVDDEKEKPRQAEPSIFDKVSKPELDLFLNIQKKRNAEKVRDIIKSCINSGRIVTKRGGKYKLLNIGSVVSYNYEGDNKISLMTVPQYRFDYNIIYGGEIIERDGIHFINITGCQLKESVNNRGLLEIEV